MKTHFTKTTTGKKYSLPYLAFLGIGFFCILFSTPLLGIGYSNLDLSGILQKYKTGCIRGLSAVAYKERIYLFSADVSQIGIEDSIRAAYFSLDSNGVVTQGTDAGRFPVDYLNQPNTCINAVASCAYLDKIYVFFVKQENYQSGNIHDIFYNTMTVGLNGEIVWEKPEGMKTEWPDTKISCDVAPDKIKAVVYNGKIHLFSLSQGFIRYKTFNGSEWSNWQQVHRDPISDFDVINFLSNDGTERLLVAWCGSFQSQGYVIIKFYGHKQNISSDSTVNYDYEWYGYHKVMNGERSFDQIALGYGSIAEASTGKDQNSVQIFGRETQSQVNQHYRYYLGTYLPGGPRGDSGTMGSWQYITRNSGTSQILIPFSLKSSSGSGSTHLRPARFQNYLIHCMYMNSGLCYVHACKSDVLQPIGEPTSLEEALDDAQKTELRKSMSTLIGVIEGVPPFPSGNQSSASSFTQKDGKNNEYKYEESWETEKDYKIGVSGNVPIKAFDIGGEVGYQGGSTAGGMTGTVSSQSMSKELEFSNSLENQDGLYGWLVLSSPRMYKQKCDRYSVSGTRLFSYMNIWADSVDIEMEPYLLENPGQGMDSRKRSSNLNYWKRAESNIRELGAILFPDMRSLSASSTGSKATVSVESSNASITSSKTSWYDALYSKLSAGVGKKDVWKASIEGQYSMKWSGAKENSYSRSDFSNLAFSLEFLSITDPAKQFVRNLQVRPYILQAKQPSSCTWIPKSFRYQVTKPFLITWRIERLDYSTPKALQASCAPRQMNVNGIPRSGSLADSLTALLAEMESQGLDEGSLEVTESPDDWSDLIIPEGRTITITAPDTSLIRDIHEDGSWWQKPSVTLNLASVTISRNASLVLTNLIINGEADMESTSIGQGIYVDGYLEMDNCILEGHHGENTSLKNGNGGAVYITAYGQANIRNSEILNNSSSESGSGGAFYVDSGKLRLSNCRILSNQAGTGGGAAIYAVNASIAAYFNVLINDNASTATGDDGAVRLVGSCDTSWDSTVFAGNLPADMAQEADKDSNLFPTSRFTNCIFENIVGNPSIESMVHSCFDQAPNDLSILNDVNNLKEVTPLLATNSDGIIIGLQENSPCIDSGSDSNSAVDLAGTLHGTRSDIGCYEYSEKTLINPAVIKGNMVLDTLTPDNDNFMLKIHLPVDMGFHLSPTNHYGVLLGNLVFESENMDLVGKPKKDGTWSRMRFLSKGRGANEYMNISLARSTITILIKIRKADLLDNFAQYGIQEEIDNSSVTLPLRVQLSDTCSFGPLDISFVWANQKSDSDKTHTFRLQP